MVKRLELSPNLEGLEVRDSRDGTNNRYTVRGHASVFGRLSENLGGFREQIAPGAFTRVLDETPDVRLLFNHDGLPLARTAAQSLELREDPHGLHIWARVDQRRTDAADLRYALEGGEVTQMSFAFAVSGDNDVRVGEDDAGVPIYEVREVDSLYDVSLVSYPAYPQTDVSLVRMRMLAGSVDDRRALRAVGDLAWAPDSGYQDLSDKIQTSLPAAADGETYPYGWVTDVSLDQSQALIRWYEDGNDSGQTYVVSVSGGAAADQTQWVPVEQEYVESVRSALKLRGATHVIARLLADRPEGRERDAAASERAAAALRDRERDQRRKVLENRARLLVVTYPLRDAA